MPEVPDTSEREEGDLSLASLRDLFSRPLAIRSIALTILTGLAVLYSLYFARPFLIPVFVALMLQFLLAPFVRVLRRARVPNVLAVLIVLLGFLTATIGGAYVLSGPAEFWVDELPKLLSRGSEELASIKEPLEGVTETAGKLEEIVDLENNNSSLRLAAPRPSAMKALLGGAWSLVLSGVITISLLFFLLSTADSFLRKLVTALESFRDKRIAVEVLRGIEFEISRYILTMCAINAGLGAAIGVAMWLLGLPNPALWGALAGIANFVPYVGGIVGCTVVTLVAFATHESTLEIALVPAAYTLINGMEGLVLTPILLGRRFALSPVVIFIWFLFWGWAWGIPGALLAIPMLVALKILCDQTPPLRFVGVLIER